MDESDSHFIALKELKTRIDNDPVNAGWYMLRAYQLGKGCSIDEAMRLPPRPRFSLIEGGKNGDTEGRH